MPDVEECFASNSDDWLLLLTFEESNIFVRATRVNHDAGDATSLPA
jgi:hypothetical protein